MLFILMLKISCYLKAYRRCSVQNSLWSKLP